MKQLFNFASKLIIILLITLFIGSCRQNMLQDSGKGAINKSINNALSWVYGHPANFAVGGFIEIAEEIITFYILSNNTEDPLQSKTFIREIEKRLKLIKSNKEFKVQPQEFTMFLAVAAITGKLGLQTIDFNKIMEDQILSNPLLYPSHITTRIWNTVYLERLGYNPPQALRELLPQSTLSKEVRQRLLFQHVSGPTDPIFLEPISITIFDLAREIFALTDFGELPPPPVIIENQAYFSELFERCIKWAMNVKHIDVLADVLMCVNILKLKDVSSFQTGIEFIVSNQKNDGTFGITNPSRPNIYRHGVLGSIMALSMASTNMSYNLSTTTIQ